VVTHRSADMLNRLASVEFEVAHDGLVIDL
jgi:hypothetical protein